jgi:hypothetical protein
MFICENDADRYFEVYVNDTLMFSADRSWLVSQPHCWCYQAENKDIVIFRECYINSLEKHEVARFTSGTVRIESGRFAGVLSTALLFKSTDTFNLSKED